MRHVVVVGASLAGFRAVEELRHEGYDGALTVIGAEPHLPYDRPPLSKQILAGTWEADRLPLTPIGKSVAELEVDWRLGVPATGLRLDADRVALADGTEVAYDGLVIATGAAVRTLPGQPELAGLHMLRTVDDCVALRADLDAAPRRVVVVGAGFIGAEVAATARQRGLDVTVLEALPVPLQRALGDQIGAVCAAIHREQGVDLRVSTGVDGFNDDGHGRLTGVRLSDGTTVETDVAVVGVGVTPNTDWLEGSGLTLDNGVVCDESCLAAPNVVAAGDVARWPNRRFGELMRVEHWENAQEQGAHAARRLLGHVEAYEPVPWFWSDQYDRKIQLAGTSRADDDVRIVDGSVAERRFVAIYGRAGRLVGVLGMNRPRAVMEYRQLIAAGTTWEEALA
ncbi:MAG TPA: FAD-dependent oxidoreductase, partial [Acidimicrobiales bacterium]|nr:FAD-dependent oxidoreductase [Acidimicrobiales bacterium]